MTRRLDFVMAENGKPKALQGFALALTIIGVLLIVGALVVWLTLPKPELPAEAGSEARSAAPALTTTTVLLGLIGLILAQGYWLSTKIDGLNTGRLGCRSPAVRHVQ